MFAFPKDDVTVIREGFIERKDSNDTDYQRLWTVLYSNKKIECKVNPAASTLVINDRNLLSIKDIERKSPTTFEVTSTETIWTLQCQNEDECDEWFGIILSLDTDDDDVPCTSLMNCIDSGLSRLYDKKGHGARYVNSDGVGLFAEFCVINGFDDESIIEELDPEYKDDCALLEFDANFPVNFQGTGHNQNIYIFDLLFGLYQMHVNVHAAKPIEEVPNGIYQVDLSVFADSEQRCKRYSKDLPITESCAAIKRLCAALLYFYALSTSVVLSKEEKKALFVEFNQEVYKSLLEDSIHFVKEHERDIQRVHTEWTGIYGLPKCSASKCTHIARHYARGRRSGFEQGPINEDDAFYNLYETAYDRLHHFLFHLFEIGMRVDTQTMAQKMKDEEEKEIDFEGLTVDKWFATERDLVNLQRDECKLQIDQYEDPKNKFMIQTVSEKGGFTLLDALFQRLRTGTAIQESIWCDECAENYVSGRNIRNKRISGGLKHQEKSLHRIKDYFEENSFDSECIEMDIEDMIDSNILNFIQNQDTIQMMADFIRSINVRRGAFSTGFQFKYKGSDCLDICRNMRVHPVHKQWKRELLESGYLSAAQWANVVELKVRQYMETEEVRKLLSHREGAPITRENICAIILYCDFTSLCTAFSATFRRLDVFETIESVKKRHSHFANFGRLLVETVWQFGLWESQQKGPFFCGLDCILNIGSYAITLKGPCSTSTVRTVALNFATKQGVIIKLENDTKSAKFTLVFDCSWISNYWEESERLWIAGIVLDKLRIVSIVVVRSAKNYENIMRALFLFDTMISFGNLAACKIYPDAADFDLLMKLVESELTGGVSAVTEFDEYLKKEWNLFLQSKTEIQLHYHTIKCYFDILSNLVIFKALPLKEYESPKGKDNIFKAEWISIFPEVQTLFINTLGQGYGSYGAVSHYKFDLKALLDSMKALPRSVHTVVVLDAGHWTQKAVNNDIRWLFAAYGWAVEYVEVERLIYRFNLIGAITGGLKFHLKSD